MLLFADALLLGVLALLVCVLLGIRTRTGLIIGSYLVLCAAVIFATELLGTLFLLDRPAAYLAVHAAFLGTAVTLWLRAGRPDPLAPFRGSAHAFAWRNLWSSIKTDPVLWLLGMGVCIVYLLAAYMLVVLSPIDADIVRYHFPRIGYWLQHKSLYHWPTPDQHQTAFPINAELLMLWNVTLWGSIQLVEFVQWFTLPVILAAVYGTTRLLGGTRRAGLFAGLVVATMPQVYFQVINAKNDVMVSGFFVCGLYLLLSGLRHHYRGELVLSGVAMGLAAGTKTTVGMIAPGLLVLLLLLWREHGRQGFRDLLLWGVSSAAAFALVGSYVYLLNTVAYGGPLGSSEFVERESRPVKVSDAEMLVVNSTRYTYQALDVTGLPEAIAKPAQRLKARVAGRLFEALDLPVTAQRTTKRGVSFELDKRPAVKVGPAWFGPLGALLLVVLIPVQAARALWQRDIHRLGLALLAASFLVVLSLGIVWSPFKGRYTVLVVAITAPFLMVLYRTRWPYRLLTWGVCLVALGGLVWVVDHTTYEPVYREPMNWVLDLAIDQKPPSTDTRAGMVRMVDQHVPPDARLGTIFKPRDWQSPLFGEDFSRTIIQVYPVPAVIDAAWLAAHPLDYLLVNDSLWDHDFPPELVIVDRTEGFTLLRPAAPGE